MPDHALFNAIARSPWQALQTVLAPLRHDTLNVASFCALAPAQTALLAALPTRFGEVFNPLLNRLAFSALFTEESGCCSRHGLRDSLQMWLDKANETLNQS